MQNGLPPEKGTDVRRADGDERFIRVIAGRRADGDEPFIRVIAVRRADGNEPFLRVIAVHSADADERFIRPRKKQSTENILVFRDHPV